MVSAPDTACGTSVHTCSLLSSCEFCILDRQARLVVERKKKHKEHRFSQLGEECVVVVRRRSFPLSRHQSLPLDSRLFLLSTFSVDLPRMLPNWPDESGDLDVVGDLAGTVSCGYIEGTFPKFVRVRTLQPFDLALNSFHVRSSSRMCPLPPCGKACCAIVFRISGWIYEDSAFIHDVPSVTGHG